jgi:hypothetical protein
MRRELHVRFCERLGVQFPRPTLLKELLGGRRLRFTDAERRRLARKAYTLGRKVLNELATLVTPDTLLRWHRE